jgi:multidrug efflux pump subunit AcrA (membrane-fusion protein)
VGNGDYYRAAREMKFPTDQIMKRNHLKMSATVAFLLTFAPAAFPHEGHNKAPGEGGDAPNSGPIAITAEAKKNLALVVEEAQLRTLDKTVLVFGQIEVIPNRSAAVSSRIPGRVADVKVTDGESVKKGQVVVEVESLQLGDPPPRVQYSSPIDGVVIDRHAVQGDSVEPNKHLMEIVDLSEVYAEGRIFEGQVAAIKTGQKVRVSVESYPTNEFTGTVDLLSGTLDAETRTLKVWVRIKNPDLKLRPNMRARLNIVTAEADSVVTVPLSAVLGEAGNLFVFVQSDTDELVYEKKPVVVGMKDDRYIEMIEGVFPSDKVVTLGNYQLQYVTTRKPVAKSTAESSTNAPASTHDEPTIAGHEHAGAATSPLLWMGIALGVLLAANAIILLFKRRGLPAPTTHGETTKSAVTSDSVTTEAGKPMVR